jgi:diguanylate cyclase (GGDEF)-like protein
MSVNRRILEASVVVLALTAILAWVSFVELAHLERTATNLGLDQIPSVVQARDVGEEAWRFRSLQLQYILEQSDQGKAEIEAQMTATESRIDVLLERAHDSIDDPRDEELLNSVEQRWHAVKDGNTTLLAAVRADDPGGSLSGIAEEVSGSFTDFVATLDAWDSESSADIDASLNDIRSAYRRAQALVGSVVATVLIGCLATALWLRRVLMRYHRSSAKALETTRTETERARIFARLSDRLAFATEEAEMVDAVVIGLQRLLPTHRGDVLLLNPSLDRLAVAAAWGSDALEAGGPVNIDRPGLCPGIRRGTIYHSSDATDALAVQCRAHPAQRGSLLCVPMLAMGEIVGVIHLERIGLDAFSGEDEQIASRAAEQAAMALSSGRLTRKLEFQAMADPLTALGNARFLDQALDRELRSAERDQLSLGVLMIDLDHFKQVNDSHGHPAGDEVLKAFARTLRTHVRQADVVARCGGEEFAVILHSADLQTAVMVGEHIRQAVEQLAIEVGPGRFVRITASVGAASTTEHGTDRVALMRIADQALYQAKALGRNRVVAADAEFARRRDGQAQIESHSSELSSAVELTTSIAKNGI